MNTLFGRTALSSLFAVVSFAAAQAQDGQIYTLTNAPGGNSLVVFERGADGTLTQSGAVGTGGLGLGSGLGSQGAVSVSQNGRWIAAVNAGDNTVSLFWKGSAAPELVTVFPSGGVHPISATWLGKSLYILNDGDAMNAPNVRGFDVSSQGVVGPIIGAHAVLSSSTSDAAQVQASPDGSALLVTEKNTNSLTVVWLSRTGGVIGVDVHASQGLTPFGFDFDGRGRVFVSEAFGGSPLMSAASSYKLVDGLGPVVVSASVPTTQTAACWLDVSKDGRWAYVANTGSGTVSRYSIARDGSIALVSIGSLGMGARAADIVASTNGRFVHVVNTAAGSIVTFRAQPDGTLEKIDEDVVGIGIVGIATR